MAMRVASARLLDQIAALVDLPSHSLGTAALPDAPDTFTLAVLDGVPDAL